MMGLGRRLRGGGWRLRGGCGDQRGSVWAYDGAGAAAAGISVGVGILMSTWIETGAEAVMLGVILFQVLPPSAVLYRVLFSVFFIFQIHPMGENMNLMKNYKIS
jgi:hypothetical protein